MGPRLHHSTPDKARKDALDDAIKLVQCRTDLEWSRGNTSTAYELFKLIERMEELRNTEPDE